MSDAPVEPNSSDLVFLLRLRAKIETASDGPPEIPVTQHIDWIAADEITRLRDSVKGLTDTIHAINKVHKDLQRDL